MRLQHVPRVMGQLREVPKMVSHDRIRQRTIEQFADIPALRVVGAPVKVLSQDRVGSTGLWRAGDRTAQDFKQGPNLAAHQSDSRCSRAASDGAVEGSVEESHGLTRRSSTSQFPVWWRNTLR